MEASMSDDTLTLLDAIASCGSVEGLDDAPSLAECAAQEIRTLRAALAEAQEDVAALKAGWPDTLVAGEELAQAERERDTARALLREITERWLIDELCGRYRTRCNSCQELKARLDAALGGEP
jgi:hypothetical protein